MKTMMYVAYAINPHTREDVRLGEWRLPEAAWWHIRNSIEWEPADNPADWNFVVVEELVEVEEI